MSLNINWYHLNYSKVSQIRSGFLFYLSLLLKNDNQIFNLLFSQKLDISVSYEVASYMRDSTGNPTSVVSS